MSVISFSIIYTERECISLKEATKVNSSYTDEERKRTIKAVHVLR